MEITASHRCHGGTLNYVNHEASSTNCPMRFSIYLPPQAESGKCATLIYLSGLTCTEENFTAKAGAYKKASQLGLIIVAPDTSPRGDNVHDEEGYDIGKGAGFYVNSTQQPWAAHYQMYRYIHEELRALLAEKFPVDAGRLGLCGHSMGGHGALTIYLKHADIYRSVSAFSPIVAPTQVPWGEKAFSAYLGPDREAWKAYDATELVKRGSGAGRPEILIDQGLADNFLANQLKPELFEEACAQAGQAVKVRRHEGYDHSYFFIQSFMDDHLAHHSALLG